MLAPIAKRRRECWQSYPFILSNQRQTCQGAPGNAGTCCQYWQPAKKALAINGNHPWQCWQSPCFGVGNVGNLGFSVLAIAVMTLPVLAKLRQSGLPLMATVIESPAMRKAGRCNEHLTGLMAHRGNGEQLHPIITTFAPGVMARGAFS
jgi:hypothetical protein